MRGKMVQGQANKEWWAVYIFVATILIHDKNVLRIIAGSIIGLVGVSYGKCFLLRPFEQQWGANRMNYSWSRVCAIHRATREHEELRVGR